MCTGARSCATETAVHHSALAGGDAAGTALRARGTLYAFPVPLSDAASAPLWVCGAQPLAPCRATAQDPGPSLGLGFFCPIYGVDLAVF